MKIKKSFNLFFLLVFLLFFLPTFSFSQEFYPGPFPEKPTAPIPVQTYLYWFYKVGIWLGGAAVIGGLILAGIKFVTSVGDPERLADARDQALKSLLGLLILIFIPTVLHIINPNVFTISDIFKPIGQLQQAEVSEEPILKVPGVYAHTYEDKEFFLVQSRSELGPELKNRIDSITTVGSYGAILFAEAKYKGHCVDIPPGFTVSISSGVSSIMVYNYKERPSGNVTFYRKAFYRGDGGTRTIAGPTNWIYLSDRRYKFLEVPEDEKKCIKWNENGSCIEREEITLAGSCIKWDGSGNCLKFDPDNGITSIKIDGDFSVLLITKPEFLPEWIRYRCQAFYNKGGKYDVANIKNEYIRAWKSQLYLMKIIPGKPGY